MMKFKYVKIVVFVPDSHAAEIRRALSESGCGHIGNYDFCSFSVKGIGRFRPLDGANPSMGKIGSVEEVNEERIETICPSEKLKKVIEVIKKNHPYEKPAIDVYPLLNDGAI